MTYFVMVDRRARALKRERDDGYIEYKWKLLDIERSRLIRLITQMNYRLNEGEGKSMYAVGFTDDGSAIGITKSELHLTLRNIISAAKELEADIKKVIIFKEDNFYWAKIFLRKNKICNITF